MRRSLALALLGLPTLLVAGRPDAELSLQARGQARARMAEPDTDFQVRALQADDLGEVHVRLQQTYRGLRVFEGETILHTRDGRVRAVTDATVPGIRLHPTPSLDAAEALALVHRDLAPHGAYADAPTAELVVYPETVEVLRPGVRHEAAAASDLTRQVVRHTLAYHVHAELENGAEETVHRDYLVNAHTGALLRTWSTLHTGKPGGGTSGTAAVGSGSSQYSGSVTLNTTLTGSGYVMQDLTRGGGNKVYDLAHATNGTGTLYGDADNGWGDGRNYTEGTSTTAANGQTAAVDAGYGAQVTWDMYKNVFGRNGIDGNGSATYSRVHYASAYDNAFWSDRCFCMTYGDGNSFTTLTALDVAGHEMTHGVTSRTANLTYSGESGGLNESHSDIFGTMAEFYRGSTGTTIPATGGNWTIGEQLASKPLRYMAKPSQDGRSPDAWYSGIGSLDVHYSSGPMNRCFYFLSQGAASSASPYLPGGMTGLGNDKAARIAYRALAVYMTSNTTYAGARAAYLSAAADLYGAGSAAVTAVANAFKAINVN